jgi:outer membrane protein OmpA-like peptidoglycan-associated protein
MKKYFILVPAFLLLLGCKSANKTQKGTAIGAAGGAVIGGLIAKNSVVGALIGAAVGGTAGYLIGKDMDKQAKELKQAVPNAEVERVGEGINMTFNSGLLFKINSAELSDGAKAELSSVSGVFKKYDDTNILLEGHTDDTGSDDFNMQLSKKRAESVSAFLVGQGVPKSRLIEKWYGETQPKFVNDSDSNRVKNRRVEIGISADENMKKEAKEGEIKN